MHIWRALYERDLPQLKRSGGGELAAREDLLEALLDAHRALLREAAGRYGQRGASWVGGMRWHDAMEDQRAGGCCCYRQERAVWRSDGAAAAQAGAGGHGQHPLGTTATGEGGREGHWRAGDGLTDA